MDKYVWQNLTNAFNDLIDRFFSWLDSLDERARNLHMFMMMGLMLILLSLGGCQYRLHDDMNQYENANLQLAQAIEKRQKDLESFRLQEKQAAETHTKLSVLQASLDKARAPAALLLELANIMPSHIRISRFVQRGDSLNLEGKAKSNADVAVLVQSLAKNAVFFDPVLISLKQSPIHSESLEDFEVAVKWKIPVHEVAG